MLLAGRGQSGVAGVEDQAAFLLVAVQLPEQGSAGHLVTLPGPLVPEIELAVYVGSYHALLTGSEFVEVLDHADAWKANRDLILRTLKHAERRRDTS